MLGRRKWYYDNREVAIRRVVESARKNPNRKAYMAEYLPKWHAEHPNYIRDRFRRVREVIREDPEKRAKELAQRVAYEAKRRAAKTRSGGSYSARELMQMYDDQEGLCAYCEEFLHGTYEADHMVPLSRGGGNDWTNIAITCPSCNRRKNSKTVEEFLLISK